MWLLWQCPEKIGTTNHDEQKRRERRACLSGNPMNRKANAMPQRIPSSAPPLSHSPRSSFTITTNSFECRCRIGNILVANSNVRLCVCVVLVVLRDAVAVKKGYQFHLLRVCIRKKNNHKKAHQRLIEKSLVRLHLPLSFSCSNNSYACHNVSSCPPESSVGTWSRCFDCICTARPGQSSLPSAWCPPHGILKLYDTQLQHIKKQIKSHKRFLCCLPRATLKLFNYIFVYYKNITSSKLWSERDTVAVVVVVGAVPAEEAQHIMQFLQNYCSYSL